ncbi:hypothetical protein BRADI_4g35435v3 [Brachypodium distachyon]|uniref:Uncharacterized protein n=1 Tax=Brachypodium distachyon TaxID=15368 RepID=A0A2K2CSG6_BRADI|nr:hypothetical protein BRADI_4g35435v3 [Brachypodium distachyon]
MLGSPGRSSPSRKLRSCRPAPIPAAAVPGAAILTGRRALHRRYRASLPHPAPALRPAPSDHRTPAPLPQLAPACALPRRAPVACSGPRPAPSCP